jgi:hypothetical protein
MNFKIMIISMNISIVDHFGNVFSSLFCLNAPLFLYFSPDYSYVPNIPSQLATPYYTASRNVVGSSPDGVDFLN